MSTFCDKTTVTFIGGKGGDGAVSFRREKHVPRGGPDGGDGGHGASVILKADTNLNTLVDFNTKKQFKAPNGGNGGKSHRAGKDGEDLLLNVPAGTLVLNTETNEPLADLKEHGQIFTVARGGRGGLGNSNFKSSVHQAPKFAETGEEGQTTTATLELQLVADIGIIGLPSAGKSTLISRISNAKPKIADYPFTTLIPNLGVVSMRDFDKNNSHSFVVADIPGLIEGAHQGKGLGHDFLRHISRTAILVHVLDLTRGEPADYNTINKELAAHSAELAKKQQIIVLSKIDAASTNTAEALIKELQKKHPALKKQTIYPISSVTGKGIKDLIFRLHQEVQQLRAVQQQKAAKSKGTILEGHVFRPHLQNKKFTIKLVRTKHNKSTNKTRHIFDVHGDRIEQVVKMTDFNNSEGVERIYHFLHKMGIKRALQKQGAQPGDTIRIAGKNLQMRP